MITPVYGPELREPTEKNACSRFHAFEPTASDHVVDVPFVSERHPNVDIREKK
jgi:hypothetical protein